MIRTQLAPALVIVKVQVSVIRSVHQSVNLFRQVRVIQQVIRIQSAPASVTAKVQVSVRQSVNLFRQV